ncbi:NAD(P)/FAD-dependent oxidoreductase [Streptomyces sp. NPDC053079]|uniref:NAD(P)/FAD-dependent oxidoreductase n=1 Tax=Streptomyces sp. NPDC053079 TaxID=3365697 RepID=UPI0037CD9FF1
MDSDPLRRSVLAESIGGWYGEDFQVLQLGSREPGGLSGLAGGGAQVALVAEVGEDSAGLARVAEAAKVPDATGLVSLVPNGGTVTLAADGGPAKAGFAEEDGLDEAHVRLIDNLIHGWWRNAQENIRKLFTSVEISGAITSKGAFRIREFLTGSGVVFTWPAGSSGSDVHVTVTRPGEQPAQFTNPTLAVLAKALGLLNTPTKDWYDVVIVGGGPAGLSAAVYAGAEGLSTLVIEDDVPGGQAGTSSKIWNYLGFPDGIPGHKLAQTALRQAKEFKVDWQPLHVAKRLHSGAAAGNLPMEVPHEIELGDGPGTRIKAGAVVVATGMTWRLLDKSTDAHKLVGAGVYYHALMTDAEYTRGKHIAMVGGGNSVGQAVVHFAQYAKKITLIVRSGLQSMSQYLVNEIKRLEKAGKVEIWLKSEVKKCVGEKNKLKQLKVGPSGKEKTADRTLDTEWLYVLIGGVPNTGWLEKQVELAYNDTILTGHHVPGQEERLKQAAAEARKRAEAEGLTGKKLEEAVAKAVEAARIPSTGTSLSRVFAIGDTQYTAPPRVGGAVGRGSACVAELFGVISQMPHLFPTYAHKKN